MPSAHTLSRVQGNRTKTMSQQLPHHTQYVSGIRGGYTQWAHSLKQRSSQWRGQGWERRSGLTLKIKGPKHIDRAAAFLLFQHFSPGHINPWFCNPTMSDHQIRSQPRSQQQWQEGSTSNTSELRTHPDRNGCSRSGGWWKHQSKTRACGRSTPGDVQGRREGGLGCLPGKRPQPRTEAAAISTHSASGFPAERLQRRLGMFAFLVGLGPRGFSFGLGWARRELRQSYGGAVPRRNAGSPPPSPDCPRWRRPGFLAQLAEGGACSADSSRGWLCPDWLTEQRSLCCRPPADGKGRLHLGCHQRVKVGSL